MPTTSQVVSHKGVVLKPLGTAHLSTSFVGVHAEAPEMLPSSQLPLQPKQSATLPLLLHIGKAPHDSFEDIGIEVRITYFSSTSSVVATEQQATQEEAAAAAAAAGEPVAIGRRLSVPLRFTIQPTLQVGASSTASGLPHVTLAQQRNGTTAEPLGPMHGLACMQHARRHLHIRALSDADACTGLHRQQAAACTDT